MALMIIAFSIFFTLIIISWFILWALGKEIQLKQGGKLVKTIRWFTVTNY